MLIDVWHPVTSDLGLIDATVETTVTELLTWHAEIGTTYSRRDISSGLPESLNALPPLSAEMRRRLFLPTTSGWTVCLQSGIRGSDPFPAMSMLASRLGVLAMRVCSAPSSDLWPATIWEVYAPEILGGQPPLNHRRSVACSNDGGRWVFEQFGEPFAFEQSQLYDHPRMRDRFTPAVLREYLAHFNLDPFNDAFYSVGPSSPAVLLNRLKPNWRSKAPEFTLEQVLAGGPWRKR